jgi:hypothetical protein
MVSGPQSADEAESKEPFEFTADWKLSPTTMIVP